MIRHFVENAPDSDDDASSTINGSVNKNKIEKLRCNESVDNENGDVGNNEDDVSVIRVVKDGGVGNNGDNGSVGNNEDDVSVISEVKDGGVGNNGDDGSDEDSNIEAEKDDRIGVEKDSNVENKEDDGEPGDKELGNIRSKEDGNENEEDSNEGDDTSGGVIRGNNTCQDYWCGSDDDFDFNEMAKEAELRALANEEVDKALLASNTEDHNYSPGNIYVEFVPE
jgi:hypothetical protein